MTTTFPKDIWRLLMTHYFAPQDAITCLRVCKYLNTIVPESKIRERVIKEYAKHKQLYCDHDDGWHQAERPTNIPCALFSGVPAMVAQDDDNLEFCPQCDAPGYNVGGSWHAIKGCPLDSVECIGRDLTRDNLIYSLCDFRGCRFKHDRHKCVARCNECLINLEDTVFTGYSAYPNRFAHLREHADRIRAKRRRNGVLMVVIFFLLITIFFTRH